MNTAISTASLYTRTGDVIEADVGGEVVLLHTQSWQYFEFDQVGGAIWNLLDTPITLDGLVRALMTDFAVDEEQCMLETKAFLENMVAQGLVVAADA